MSAKLTSALSSVSQLDHSLIGLAFVLVLFRFVVCNFICAQSIGKPDQLSISSSSRKQSDRYRWWLY